MDNLCVKSARNRPISVLVVHCIIFLLLFGLCCGDASSSSATKQLSCYQCKNFGGLGRTECEDYQKWTNSTKEKFRLACPQSVAEFCYKRTQLTATRSTPPKRVRRGCMGKTSKHGVALREGCVLTIDGNDVEFLTCFCKTDMCNGGNLVKPLPSVTGLLLNILLWKILFH